VLVLLNASTRRDVTGNIIGVIGVGQDITELDRSRAELDTYRKDLEKLIETRTAEVAEERNLLRTLIDNVPDYIYVKDVESRFVLTNPSLLRSMGKEDLGAVIGKTDLELLPPGMAEQFYADEQALFKTGEALVDREELSLNPEGNEMWALTTKVPLRDTDGKITGLVGITRNITTIKQAFEKERELGELKSSFVSMASHEFRTPLTTILSSNGLLRLYVGNVLGTEVPDRLTKHFDQIEAAVRHTTGLLDDVLMIGKAEAGRLEFNPQSLDIQDFCMGIVEEFMPSAESRNEIVFSSTGQCEAVAMDEKLLRHILTNLLSNAIKYTLDSRTVRFDLSCESETVTFRVQDEGIGIPEADHEQLFQSFHRAKNVGTIAGTGLGLAITKHSVELHGGTIDFRSEVSVGTTFTVVIPVTRPIGDNG
jgi:PAS domain S-box-containing protein